MGNPTIGHGLLTHFLLEALLGAEEVRKGGKVSIYRLLEYVTERVIDAARQFGARQEPTLRGTLDGALSWPIFTPGARFAAAFPDVYVWLSLFAVRCGEPSNWVDAFLGRDFTDGDGTGVQSPPGGAQVRGMK